MTPQEQQLLQGLVQRVQGTQLPSKDQEAEQLIRQSLYSNPDALYILCQTVLVQQYALEQAQKQLADARQQMETLRQAAPGPQQAEHHTSFLGKLFGAGDDAPQTRQITPQVQPASQANQPQYAPVTYAGAPPQPGYGVPPQQYGQPQYMPAPQSSGMFGGGGFGGGGFLQGAMQTAAGVAAGELAFRGIEDLMHGFGHSAGYGSDRALGGFDDRSNFADSGQDNNTGNDFGDRLQTADNAGSGMSPDIEDRRSGDGGGSGFFGGDSNDSSSSFADAGDSDSGGSFGSDDSSDFGGDDSSSDFSSGGDDSF